MIQCRRQTLVAALHNESGLRQRTDGGLDVASAVANARGKLVGRDVHAGMPVEIPQQVRGTSRVGPESNELLKESSLHAAPRISVPSRGVRGSAPVSRLSNLTEIRTQRTVARTRARPSGRARMHPVGTAHAMATEFPGDPVPPLTSTGLNDHANSYARSAANASRSRFSLM